MNKMLESFFGEHVIQSSIPNSAMDRHLEPRPVFKDVDHDFLLIDYSVPQKKAYSCSEIIMDPNFKGTEADQVFQTVVQSWVVFLGERCEVRDYIKDEGVNLS